jgi:hypothetical protein
MQKAPDMPAVRDAGPFLPYISSQLQNMFTQTTKKERLFTCYELAPSAFLWARGARFLGLELSPTPKNPNRIAFRFHDADGLCQYEVLAFQKGVAIPAQQYALAYKLLKDQIFRRILR